MRMAVKAKETRRRRRAIYALARVPGDDEVFAFLNSMLEDPAVGDAAAYALGQNADPRCQAAALRIAKSGGPLDKEAAKGVGFDVRPPAELLQVALTDDVKGRVVESLSGLRAWDTPEALAALDTFRQKTARPLLARWGDMEDDDGTWEEYESSIFLGQQHFAGATGSNAAQTLGAGPGALRGTRLWRGCGRISMRRTQRLCSSYRCF